MDGKLDLGLLWQVLEAEEGITLELTTKTLAILTLGEPEHGIEITLPKQMENYAECGRTLGQAQCTLNRIIL